jgi:hypothetical protein
MPVTTASIGTKIPSCLRLMPHAPISPAVIKKRAGSKISILLMIFMDVSLDVNRPQDALPVPGDSNRAVALDSADHCGKMTVNLDW